MNSSLMWNGINLTWAYHDLLPSIFRRIHCKHLAFDILHDALVRFALAKNEQRHAQPEAYLTTIVRNLLIDSHHEAAMFVPMHIESGNESSGDFDHLHSAYAVEELSPSPERLLDIQQRLQLLQKIIDSLPPKCRDVFWMFRIEGMSQNAIAVHYQISVNMVERHIIRALVDLRAAKALIYP
ncbi:sigma-70 family RNA polymerase sigma factor [Methylotenera sp. 1P/1]|uniref:sigma-70 family RNA polymerase sigma factor n=1 Tax=Methylotenera sp. 1P/1 TaxID=1131551 RepID=UPI000372F005|nr:sigma-70 family RNA polymerase sigma factor [Methylotenera sp. 1P/1]